MSAISNGSLEFISKEKLPKNVLAYKRKIGSEEVLVVMNFGTRTQAFNLSEKFSQPLLSISTADKISDNNIILSGFGGMVIAK